MNRKINKKINKINNKTEIDSQGLAQTLRNLI